MRESEVEREEGREMRPQYKNPGRSGVFELGGATFGGESRATMMMISRWAGKEQLGLDA